MMIRLVELSADVPQFKTVQFASHFNVLVAERTREATSRDSRNGLGKTTFIALVDFCLGANIGDRTAQLIGLGWEFTLSVTSGEQAFQVSRSPARSGDVRITGPVVELGLVPPITSGDAPTSVVVSVNAWREWLGNNAFGLDRLGGDVKPPTYRSLVKHFIRYRLDSFLKPFVTFANQSAAQVQLENAFLLDLDWRLAVDWAKLQDTKRRLAVANDPDHDVEDQIGSLESQLVRHGRRASMLRRQLERFEVLPEYKEIEQRANALTVELKSLANQNVADLQLLEMYRARSASERDVETVDVAALFEEAGVVLGDQVVVTLATAEQFYSSIVKNRAEYLAAEVAAITERIETRGARQGALAAEHRAALSLLESHGALEDFIVLQRQLATAEAAVAETESRVANLRDLRKRIEQVKAAESSLRARSVADLDERFELRSEVISRFGEILDALYGEPADLEVVLGKTGFQFRTSLPRVGSSGVERMAVFAYDIAIIEQQTRSGRGPGLLIHDSTMFDGVDERQTAHALDIAAKSSVEFGYQYIATLNSDSIPWEELADGEAFAASIILTLTDSSEDGGLLGLRLHEDGAEPDIGSDKDVSELIVVDEGDG